MLNTHQLLITTAVLVLITAHTAEAACPSPLAEIFYVNGVGNNRQAADTSRLALEERIDEKMDADCVAPIVRLAWNPTSGLLKDIPKARKQLREGVSADDPILLEHLDQYRNALRLQRTVVVVAHSQGNLYANKAFEVLQSDSEPYSDHPISIVAVATPASSVAGYPDFCPDESCRYVTLHEDTLWPLFKEENDTVLPSNLTTHPAAASICYGGAFQAIHYCHQFVDWYLDKQKSRDAILDHIFALIPWPTTATILVGSNRSTSWTLEPGGHSGSGLSASHIVTPGPFGTVYTLTPAALLGSTFTASNSDGGAADLVVAAGQTKSFSITYTQSPVGSLAFGAGTVAYRDVGISGTAFLFDPLTTSGIANLFAVTGPSGWNAGVSIDQTRYQPPGIDSRRAFSWEFTQPVTGTYRASASVGGQVFAGTATVNASNSLTPPLITNIASSVTTVTVNWSASGAGSFVVYLHNDPVGSSPIRQQVVGGSETSHTFAALSLTVGQSYRAEVFALSQDVRTAATFGESFNISSSGAMAFTVPSSAPGHTFTWLQKLPSTVPSVVSDYAMTYDAARHEVVLFGGVDESGSPTADTWVWNGTDWTQRFPAHSPLARSRPYHVMAYDAARRQVVLYDSYSTWVWDGTDWTNTFANRPPIRRRHRMAYDAARAEMVLVLPNSIYTGSNTWVWDGVEWTEKSPQHRPGYYLSAITYDAGNEVVFLKADNGMWTWDGNDWTRQPQDIGVSTNAMAYDPSLGQIVLFGGLNLRNDTWVWDGTGFVILESAASPPAGGWPLMVYDASRAQLVLFGRWQSPAGNQTWVSSVVK